MEQTPTQVKAATLSHIYSLLFDYHGEQSWWPAETPFEVMVGAILTQNTAWTNVEKAIKNLKDYDVMSPEALLDIPVDTLATMLKPSGYFNVKTQRLRNFCEWFLSSGGYTELASCNTDYLRTELLGVKGVGPETADDILLYAFERTVFVVDAYTRRIFSRLGLVNLDLSYEQTRSKFEAELKKDTKLFNQYHALIVMHAKDFCKTKPNCEQCCLIEHCSYNSGLEKEQRKNN